MNDKKVRITIRIDPIEKMRIKRWAFESGQTMTDYIIEAIRERLAKDEIPIDEKSDLELMQSELRKSAPPDINGEPNPELDDMSLTDLIKDYVNEDETVS